MALSPLIDEDLSLATHVDALLRIDAVLRKYERDLWAGAWAPQVAVSGNAEGDMVIDISVTLPPDIGDIDLT